MRSKYFVYTLNNYTQDELDKLRGLGVDDGVEYHVHGREVGENGTPHLQGYIEFNRRLRLNQVKELCGARLHLEKRRGTPQQARDYCVKDGDYWEKGTISAVSQGSRTDLQATAELIMAGKRIREVAESFPVQFIKYHRGIKALQQQIAPRRTWVPEVLVHWGPPDVGKSRTFWDNEPEGWAHTGTKWFDGYDGQEAVLFDEFDGGWWKITYLLKLLDRYPMDVEVKGGFTSWVPRRIYITSNVPPEEWYPGARAVHMAALRRRLTRVVHLVNLMN